MVICMLIGKLSMLSVLLSGACCVAIIAWRYSLYKQCWSVMRSKRSLIDSYDWPALALSAALAAPMWTLYSTRMIPEQQGSLMSAGSCYGDLPIHMQIAESFLSGCNQDMSWGGLRSPIFWPEPLTYPFLPDFHAALLVRAGANMSSAFAVTGFLMASSLWVLLYSFTVRVTRSRLGGLLAVAMTICAGGLGGPRWIQAQGWATAMQNDVVQHDHTGEWKHLWFAFIPHILLPQRGGTFAYPIAVLSLLLVWLATDPDDRPAGIAQEQRLKLDYTARTSLLVHAGAFAAMLPLVQAHAFIGIGVIIGTLAAGDAHKWLAEPRLATGWAAAGATTLALAGPQMKMFMKTVTAGAYGHFLSYGWLYKKDLYVDFGTPHDIRGFYRFWWHSLGPVLPLFTLGMALYVFESFLALRFGRRLAFLSGGAPSAGPSIFSKAVKDISAVASQGSQGDGKGKRVGIPYATDSDEEDRILDDARGKGGVASAGGLVAVVEERLVQAVSVIARSSGLDRMDAPAGLGLQLCNSMTSVYSRRPLDCLKLAVGALLVFLLGNYVNFQPWDRDNAKLYYIFIFVASALNGALLAVPAEALFTAEPGWSRLSTWLRLTPPLGPSLSQVLSKRLGEGGATVGIAGGSTGAGTGLATGIHRSASASLRSSSRGSGLAQEAASTAGSSSSETHGQGMMGARGVALAQLIAVESPTLRITRGSLSLIGLLLLPSVLLLACISGLMLVLQEYKGTYPLFDPEARRVGLWFQEHTGPRVSGPCLHPVPLSRACFHSLAVPPCYAVQDLVAHSNSHVQPCASLAGRPSLVAYYGWVSNHGYNANERLGDRDYLMENMLKEEVDERSVSILDKYDIAYVLAEGDNVKYQGHNGPLYLAGRLKQVHTQGRYRIFQVQPR